MPPTGSLVHNSMLVAPICVYDMSKCSSLDALHDRVVCMHVSANLYALIFVAEVLSDINCWNLLIVNIMYASCEWCNFVPVDPMMMILICKCSALHVVHVGVLCIHVRVHLDILTPVPKVHFAVNY